MPHGDFFPSLFVLYEFLSIHHEQAPCVESEINLHYLRPLSKR